MITWHNTEMCPKRQFDSIISHFPLFPIRLHGHPFREQSRRRLG